MTARDDLEKYPQLPCNGQIPGRLRLPDGTDLECRSVEVAKFTLSVLTQADLEIAQKVILMASAEHEIPLQVTYRRRDAMRQDFWRVGIKVFDAAHDICHIFDHGGCLRRVEEGQRQRGASNRAVPRYVPQKTLEFKASLIGSREPYRFRVENLSRSGLLLSLPIEEGAPFRVNTILDLEIDEKRAFLNRPLRCTGKVVRMVTGDEQDQKMMYYGIVITDVPEHHAGLEELIRAIDEELTPKDLAHDRVRK